jgi:PTH1 family peptidyl-tRNA hydrolase
MMKIIIGLGNPGLFYTKTKHSVGNIFVSWLAKHKLGVKETGQSSLYSMFTGNGNVSLCISKAFMNQSGRAVNSILRKYPTVTLEDIIIVHDDLEHKVGNVRIKDGGSAE